METKEQLTKKENFRYTMKPINPKYQILYDIYKKQEASYWTADEIDFSRDYDDFLKLSEEEQYFIEMILAFFAGSDGLVNLNIRENFMNEIQVTEAQIAYGYQQMMENIHGLIYGDMLENIVRDPKKRVKLFNAFETIPEIGKMEKFGKKWMDKEKKLGARIIAFAAFEGIIFSGQFASIFWLKKYRGEGKLFMEGLIKSNRFIARDEGLHCNFACALYYFIEDKLTYEEVKEILLEATYMSIDYFRNSIKCKMIGMNIDLMEQYIKHITDRLITMLGYMKIFNVENPFDFMESIGLINKDNFFETRPDEYKKMEKGEIEFDKDGNIVLLDDF